MSEPEKKLIVSGEIPAELGKALEGLISGLADRADSRAQPKRPVPATKEQLAELLEAALQPRFKVGDIVKLRNWAKGHFKWPLAGDECIVTQVLDKPIREGEQGTAALGRALTFAIAFYDPNDGQLMEFLHDARMFVRIGSIYDTPSL